MQKEFPRTQKTEKCVICGLTIVPPNSWLRYHIKYNPPIVIMACKYCNYTEFCIRNNRFLSKETKKRYKKVLSYHLQKFNHKI